MSWWSYLGKTSNSRERRGEQGETVFSSLENGLQINYYPFFVRHEKTGNNGNVNDQQFPKH